MRSAHGLAGVRDLPVPLWLFYYGAAIVLVVSFIALGVLWRRAWLERHANGRSLPPVLQRVLLSRGLRVVAGALSFALLCLVTAAALFGTSSVDDNLAPTFVYVVFWLGLVPFVVLLGNVWSALSPWRAAADAYVWFAQRLGRTPAPLAAYPTNWGRWPATIFLSLWAVLELAYFEPANPRAVGIAILFYSVLTWYGMAVFGRRAWLGGGEAFNVYFGLLGRLAPIALRREDGRRELVLRPPLTGLSLREAMPGTLPFIAVMLGSVTFDGFSRTTFWQNRRFDLTSHFIEDSPTVADLVWTVFNAAGLILVIGLVALAFLVALYGAQLLADRRLATADFVFSLVPIALAYLVAHYFSYLIQRGQYVIPLASDPFGFGWDLFGTADYRLRQKLISDNVTWYTQVGALVVGHVLGLVLAHDRAVALFRSGRAALNAQYALLALMILYTVTGLWLLWQG